MSRERVERVRERKKERKREKEREKEREMRDGKWKGGNFIS